MYGSLDQVGQISRDALDDFYQELSNGVNNLRGIGDKSRQHAGDQLQRAVCDSGNTLDQHVDQGQNKSFDSFSNRRSAVGNYLTERHDSLAQLFGDSGNQSGNSGNNGCQPGHDDGHAGSHRGCESSDADCNSRQPGSNRKETSANAEGSNANQSERAGKPKNSRNERGEHSTRNADDRKCSRQRDQPLGDGLPAHGAKDHQYRGKNRQCACRHQHSGGPGQRTVHQVQANGELSESHAERDETFRDLLPTHAAHLPERIRHDFQGGPDSDQTHAKTDHVLRHQVHRKSDLSQSDAHGRKASVNLLPAHGAESLHGRREDLHSCGNLNEREPCGDNMLGITCELGKSGDFKEQGANGSEALCDFSPIHLSKVLTGRGQHLDCGRQDDDTG